MNKLSEKELIHKIQQCFPKSSLHKSNFFERDAELFDYKNNQLLFTTDDFSSEDLFREVHPIQLGRNLAIASLSDILASGGDPLYYAHAMTISRKWDEQFIVNVSKGISEVLTSSNIHFLGGDFGKSDHWHYTGIVIGEAVVSLSRMGAEVGHNIYMTGKAGAGNLEAALYLYSEKLLVGTLLKAYKTRFHLRSEEAKLIRNYASVCIDTSDGIYNAVRTISELNHCGFLLENIPLIPEAAIAAKLTGKPAELLIMGECGEYELLFTVSPDKTTAFEKEFERSRFEISKIGVITEKQTKVIKSGKKVLNLHHFEISGRAYDSEKEYLASLEQFIRNA